MNTKPNSISCSYFYRIFCQRIQTLWCTQIILLFIVINNRSHTAALPLQSGSVSATGNTSFGKSKTNIPISSRLIKIIISNKIVQLNHFCHIHAALLRSRSPCRCFFCLTEHNNVEEALQCRGLPGHAYCWRPRRRVKPPLTKTSNHKLSCHQGRCGLHVSSSLLHMCDLHIFTVRVMLV